MSDRNEEQIFYFFLDKILHLFKEIVKLFICYQFFNIVYYSIPECFTVMLI